MLTCKARLVRDVSRIISSVQTWCPVPPLAQASANPPQGAPKPPYPEGSWPSLPAHGIPQLPYGTSPRRFGTRVSSAAWPPSPTWVWSCLWEQHRAIAKRVSRLAVPKKIIGSYIIAADRLMRSALNSTVPRRACDHGKRHNILLAWPRLPVALAPLRYPWL